MNAELIETRRARLHAEQTAKFRAKWPELYWISIAPIDDAVPSVMDRDGNVIPIKEV